MHVPNRVGDLGIMHIPNNVGSLWSGTPPMACSSKCFII